MMELIKNKTVLRKKVRVASFECDLTNRMKLSYLLRQIEESSTDHYAMYGHDYDDLLAHDQIFILSKMFIKVNRTLKGGEFFYIDTWENKYEGVFCVRNFVCHDVETEEIIAECKSYWIIVDFNEHKIIRPRDCAYETHFVDEQINIDEYKRITPENVENLQDAGQFAVLYKDIDRYRHLNNTVYCDIASSYIPVDYMDNEICEFGIFFKHESKIGDVMDIKFQKMQDGKFFVGGYKQEKSSEENKNKQQENFVCYIKVRPIK